MARRMVVFNKRTGRYETYRGAVGRPFDPNDHYGQMYKTEAQYNDAMQRMYDKRLVISDTEMAGDPDKATITVDWTNPGIYGRQAAARVDYTYTDRPGYVVQKEISPDIYSIRRAKVKNMAMKAKSNSRMGLDKLCGRRRF